jgi:hypothetical protein
MARRVKGRVTSEGEIEVRIDRLFLKRFKNLQEFEVDFKVTSSRQVIVGRNGVGKSNLLEAVAWIFRELDLEEEPWFCYEIEYHCNGHYVKITAEEQPYEDRTRHIRSYAVAAAPQQPQEMSTDRDYQRLSQKDFYERNRPINGEINPDRLLPLYVFGYYAGQSGRLQEVFSKHEERYYHEQISGEEAPLRPLFLAKPHHSQFALLSFFVSDDEPAREFLRSEFGIDGLQSVLFALHE